MEIEESYTPSQLRKARALVADHRIRRDDTYPNIWWVDSPNHPNGEYRVTTAPPTCSCAYGLHRGLSFCYHVAAARMAERDGT